VVNVLVDIKHHSADLCGFKLRLLHNAGEAITPFSLEAPPHPKQCNFCCKVVCFIVNGSLENQYEYGALVV
jgi:hypothetical protein